MKIFSYLWERVDLHILALISIVLPMFIMIVPSIIEKSHREISPYSFIGVSIIIFLIPQGIILTREVKIKKFIPRIQNKQYFWVNEFMALFYAFIYWAWVMIFYG